MVNIFLKIITPLLTHCTTFWPTLPTYDSPNIETLSYRISKFPFKFLKIYTFVYSGTRFWDPPSGSMLSNYIKEIYTLVYSGTRFWDPPSRSMLSYYIKEIYTLVYSGTRFWDPPSRSMLSYYKLEIYTLCIQGYVSGILLVGQCYLIT